MFRDYHHLALGMDIGLVLGSLVFLRRIPNVSRVFSYSNVFREYRKNSKIITIIRHLRLFGEIQGNTEVLYQLWEYNSIPVL